MKYLDWKRAAEIAKQNPDALIVAGLREDWEYTHGGIFNAGTYGCDWMLQSYSTWATPVIVINGEEEIECYTEEEPDDIIFDPLFPAVPRWWGRLNAKA